MSARLFREREEFGPRRAGYSLLPFRFMRWSRDEVLVTNDGGEFHFLDRTRFTNLVSHRLNPADPAFVDLEAKQFLYTGGPRLPIELQATKLRTRKSFLEGFTRLHMFVVTLRCDHSCRYCQVSRVSTDRARFDMTEEIARRAIDLIFECPAEAIKVEFQGGEPLLNFDLIRFVIEEVQRRNQTHGKEISFVIASNLTALTDDILQVLADHHVDLSISLDGPDFVHDVNRPRPGRDSHALTVRNLEKARTWLGQDRVSAIMTTTKHSLAYPREIVDEYIARGFDGIFLRPVSPYGFAVRTGEAWRYQEDEFLAFYRTALDRVVEANREGTDLVEIYAQIILSKILTPFSSGYVDLQSPAGAGIGAVAYNYDGRVYASDEARMLAAMGDHAFLLGDLRTDGYEEIFGNETLQGIVSGSILETMPGCSECAFVPYCGTDPVFHYRTQGDIIGHRPTSAFCHRNMSIIRHLFDLLRGDDLFVRDLLVSWGTRVPLPGRAEEAT